MPGGTDRTTRQLSTAQTYTHTLKGPRLALKDCSEAEDGMDAILFSANPTMVEIDDAVRHLADHDELYWEVPFPLARNKFSYPMLGFIHISGGQVEYRVTIRDAIPFSPEHYEREGLAERLKPEPWRREWRENLRDVRSRPWKTALVISSIEPFSYDTYKFRRQDGSLIQRPPRSYVRVLPPEKSGRLPVESHHASRRSTLAERNLEDFVVQQLEEIESGLRLEERQLNTAAGRLDLLCKDRAGQYVVLELKRAQGSDQVVGQILRYMGWVLENYLTDSVRGIIVVGRKDQALSYAVRALPNVQIKEFRLSIK